MVVLLGLQNVFIHLMFVVFHLLIRDSPLCLSQFKVLFNTLLAVCAFNDSDACWQQQEGACLGLGALLHGWEIVAPLSSPLPNTMNDPAAPAVDNAGRQPTRTISWSEDANFQLSFDGVVFEDFPLAVIHDLPATLYAMISHDQLTYACLRFQDLI
jgi:hypothetical protein